MLKILLSKNIDAPKEVVWRVISNTNDYPLWNKFIVECDSTFEVGATINMKVKVLPFIAMPQKETIFQNKKFEILEYGIRIPLGILSSSRKHVLTPIGKNRIKYDSVFILRGLLARLVAVLLGSQLKRGFADMTDGIASQSIEINKQRSLTS